MLAIFCTCIFLTGGCVHTLLTLYVDATALQPRTVRNAQVNVCFRREIFAAFIAAPRRGIELHYVTAGPLVLTAGDPPESLLFGAADLASWS